MGCFLRQQLNHLLVVLVSIPMCLLFLSILVASAPYFTLSSLFIICIYLLGGLLSDMSSILFSVVIMLSPLVSRMLIYIFLLFSIIIAFYYLFGTICLISGRFYLLGWPQPLGFSQPQPILFICHYKGFHIFICLNDILVLVHSKQVGKRANHFCVPYWFTFDYILILPSLTFTSLRHFVSWGYVGYCPYVNIFFS